MENHHRNSEFSHGQWWFSIAFCMFTRPGTIDFLGSCRYLSTGKVLGGQILSINGGKTMPYCTIPQSSPLKKNRWYGCSHSQSWMVYYPGCNSLSASRVRRDSEDIEADSVWCPSPWLEGFSEGSKWIQMVYSRCSNLQKDRNQCLQDVAHEEKYDVSRVISRFPASIFLGVAIFVSWFQPSPKRPHEILKVFWPASTSMRMCTYMND